MNDKHVGGYISLTTHELNINESKYSGRGTKFSDSENNNTYDRSERNGGGGNRGRMMLNSRGDKDKFNRNTSSKKRGGPRNGGSHNNSEGEGSSSRGAVRNKVGSKPKAANAFSEKKAFRLGNI